MLCNVIVLCDFMYEVHYEINCLTKMHVVDAYCIKSLEKAASVLTDA